jgi:hypothetical protein
MADKPTTASGDKPGYDEHFYECRSCDYSETVYVKRGR